MAFRIAQLSDLHLTGDFNQTKQDPSVRQFLACLGLALSYQPDFLLLTGDLINNGDKDGYAWLFDTLTQTGVPFVCLAGNHDVTFELGHELPYEQRQFFPIAKDERLISHACFVFFKSHGRIAIRPYLSKVNLSTFSQFSPLPSRPTHQLICLNSAVSGKEFGRLSPNTLAWLDTILSQTSYSTIIALHHPPINIGSAWIDDLRLQNDDELFAILKKYPHIHTILTGHVHQAHTLSHANVQILTAPAVSRQFLPFSDTFALDDDPTTGQAGFRLIDLSDTAPYLDSQVIRLLNSATNPKND